MIKKIFFCGSLFLILITLFSGQAMVIGANWWGKFGEPKYGGTLIVREAALDSVSFDPAAPMGGELAVFYEGLFMHDWTLDRNIWPFRTGYVPTDYMVGMLAESTSRNSKYGVRLWDCRMPFTVKVQVVEKPNRPPLSWPWKNYKKTISNDHG